MTEPEIPAASLILMRDAESGPPELLFVRRAAALRFAGGAYVFPGGRIDPADREGARPLIDAGLDPEEAAARIAAIRETEEETGIALGAEKEAALALTPFARWCPEIGVKRRFDTRFFLAEPRDRADPIADGVESTHAFWATAEAVLTRCATGDGYAIFPTRRLLERLAGYASFEQARADALARPQIIIRPRIERREDGEWLTIPQDAGYPVTAERIETALRY
ncbi:MAG TPA: NUDIX domain-containing protein [Sphingomonas sp.]|nr:NUDIX domain-containing protein [Sphingomonas sp.]